MFLKIGELKRIMKDALKSSGLIVGNTGEWFLVYTENGALPQSCSISQTSLRQL